MRFVVRWPHECVIEWISDDINGTIPRGRTSEPHFLVKNITMLPIVTDGYLLLPFVTFQAKMAVLLLQWTKRTGNEKLPGSRVHFLLQKNRTYSERQLRITCPESGAFFVQTITEVNMDYENFKEELIEGLKENFETRGIEGMSFRDQGQVNKLNGGYDGVVVTPQDSAIGVTVNMTKLYEAHENGAPLGEIIDKAADMVVNGLDNQPKIDVATLTDYDQMREKLIMEVVSTEANKEMLSNIPHKEMEDMSVVYRFDMGTNEDGRATILVTNQLMDSMGINAEQLHADAVENAPKIKPVEIKGMGEVLSEMMGMSPEDMAMMGMPTDPADEKIFVATVPDKVHGAGVLAYQDFMDQAAERVGGDFFILPSSIHEILIVPDTGEMGLKDLKNMVQEVNATQVAPEDKLTDSVYHYDAKNKIFELGEKFVSRQAERDADIGDKEEARDSVLGDLKAKKEEAAKQPKKEPKEKAVNKNKGGKAI